MGAATTSIYSRPLEATPDTLKAGAVLDNLRKGEIVWITYAPSEGETLTVSGPVAEIGKVQGWVEIQAKEATRIEISRILEIEHRKRTSSIAVSAIMGKFYLLTGDDGIYLSTSSALGGAFRCALTRDVSVEVVSMAGKETGPFHGGMMSSWKSLGINFQSHSRVHHDHYFFVGIHSLWHRPVDLETWPSRRVDTFRYVAVGMGMAIKVFGPFYICPEIELGGTEESAYGGGPTAGVRIKGGYRK